MKTILIVEDSPAMRSMLSSTIESMDGFRTVAAANGFEALRILPRERIDLILTDINMPDINGLELISFLKQNPRYEKTPLIILSTEGSEKDRTKGLSLGADEYLVKPFDPAKLQAVICRYVA
ncbi:PleD family two-component system response regulator [Geobacter sp. DSM 9736]|uniref:response regulator n=1 Tax=Geobacter sp. DSM 9736 TaxID=1277350 RepID=UPI000B508AB9|nr:response regulator [Geobacter sp. DSM 9736]SNB45087.1 two-component system, chemotaxis family, response regulator CheY [Geobacter sp. DSM 9736]